LKELKTDITAYYKQVKKRHGDLILLKLILAKNQTERRSLPCLKTIIAGSSPLETYIPKCRYKKEQKIISRGTSIK
jgi:hypothetical protein